MANLNDIRRDFGLSHLEESDLARDPIQQFELWIQEAIQSNVKDPNGMALATADAKGRVSVRMMLLKYFDQNGFVFFTNYESLKGRMVAENPHASLLFWWPDFERQVRVEGLIEKLDQKHSDEYFNERLFESNIAALLSKQSRVLSDKQAFIDEVEQARKEFHSKPILRPDYWGGYILKPHYFEFWQGGTQRLHDRLVYQMKNDRWSITRLYP